MANPPPTPPAIPQGPAPSLTPKETIELLSKFITALLFSVYVFGFLITSLHTSVYGFNTINPLRPKILAAGAWFLLFVTTPVMLAISAKTEVFDALDKGQWSRLARWAIFYWASCAALSTATIPLFSYDSVASALHGPSLIVVTVACVIFAAAYLCLALVKALWLQRAALGLLSAAVLCNCGSSIYSLLRGKFHSSDLTTWFLILTIWVLVEMRIVKNLQRWAMTVFFSLMVLVSFARYIYPKMKSSLGGGNPTPVVLYLSKDSPVTPGKQLRAVLLDESDAGYYIVPTNETKAIFFPRNAVSLVLFAEDASDSLFLRMAPP